MEKKVISKIINPNSKSIVKINRYEEYGTEIIEVRKAFLKGNDLDKMIEMSISNNIIFKGYENQKDIYTKETIYEFNIDKKDEIYHPLSRLLKDKKEIILEDEHTTEYNSKFLKIEREGNNIKFSIFDNNISKPIYNRFNIFLKSPRYKDDENKNGLLIKIEIIKCFSEIKEILTNEEQQMTLDEYFDQINNNCRNPFMNSGVSENIQDEITNKKDNDVKVYKIKNVK